MFLVIEAIIKTILFIGLVAVTILTFLQTIFRHIGSISFPGANELTLLAVVWVYFIGMAYATLKDENIQGGMEGVIKSRILRKALMLFSAFLSAVFSIIATYYSLLLVESSISRGYESIFYSMPDYYWTLSIFVGFFLNSIFFSKKVIFHFCSYGWRKL